MRERHQSGDLKNVIHRGADITLVEWRNVPRYKRIEKHGHIVRRPTQVKSHHNEEDQLHRLGTGVWHGSEQAPKNSNVAESNGEEGNQEEDVLQVNANQLPGNVVITAVWVIIMGHDHAEDEMRGRGTEAQEPDKCRNPDGIVCGSVQDHWQGVHHSYVAMHRHNCEKDEAAVVAQVEYEAHWFAGEFSKCPTEDEVGGPEGQAESKNQVRDGQVQEERIGQGFQIFIFNQHQQDQCIAYKAEYGDHHKNGWGDYCSKLYHFGLVA